MRQASVVTQGGLAGAIARGTAAREQWFASGELVPASALAERWGLTARTLGAAAKRGEVLALMRGRRRYHPSDFLTLGRDVVSHICRALSGLSPETQLVFWKRTHGVLGGKTVSDFLGRSGAGEEQVRRVTALAQAWATESNGR